MSNQITMQARLGKDPETRDVGETSVCRLWVAESETYKNRDGEKVETTNWWSAECWGKRGEAIQRFFKKGDGILIRGSLRQSKKAQDDGTEKTYTSIRIEDWEFPMSRKSEGGDAPRGSSDRPSDPADDDLPF